MAMRNDEFNKKIIENVKNRIVVSNLESEEHMKISKKKQIISIASMAIIMVTGSFFTVNAATNGELVKKIKEKINITIVNEDGTEETLEDANIYVTDNNEYVVEYLIKDDSNTQNQTEESFKIYTNTLEEENKTVDAKVSENETNIEIGE